MKAISTAHPLKKIFRQLGEGVAEYIIVVVLIAVASIGIYSMFGKTIHRQVVGLTGEVVGAEISADKKTATAAASDVTAKAPHAKSITSHEQSSPGGITK